MALWERTLQVAVGAVDLAAEKARSLPPLSRLRPKPLIEQVRELEPKLRRRTEELQARGEQVVDRARHRLEQVRRGLAGRLRERGARPASKPSRAVRAS